MAELVELSGSAPLPVDPQTTPLPGVTEVTVTVVLGRQRPLTADVDRPLTRDELETAYGADPAAVDRLTAHATGAGLTVVDADLATRLVTLGGTHDQVAVAFGSRLVATTGGHAPTGPVTLPADVAADVVAVLGLDTRAAARHQSRIRPNATAETAYTPVEIATRYAFPDGDGTGQVVAIIELGGGYQKADITDYATALGLPAPHVTAVHVQGGRNAPTGDPSGPDGEVCLDIEVVAAVCPKAQIRVYFAPNTDAGFVAAVSQAIHDAAGVTVMSISWGSAESTWTSSSTAAFDAALADAAAQGITVCVASGDNGSADGQSDGEPHADFPASSPHALGCGGTRLPSSGVEVVWNDGADGGAGGGGFSTSFPVPAFQRSLTYQGSVLPGRGVPDVSADADPETGYRVRIDGTDTVIGGTSAAAPLWAALIARIQQASGEKRWLTPLIYALPAGTLFDVTSGDNGAYAAGPGWDPCSGLGTPAGGKLGAALETSLETSP